MNNEIKWTRDCIGELRDGDQVRIYKASNPSIRTITYHQWTKLYYVTITYMGTDRYGNRKMMFGKKYFNYLKEAKKFAIENPIEDIKK